MTAVALDRVVAVVVGLADGREEVGSGYIVQGGLVITAEHCTRDREDRTPAGGIRVIRASDGSWTDEVEVIASATVDVALLRVLDSSWCQQVVPRLRFGRVDRTRSGILQDCQAVGFPLFERDPQRRQRSTSELHGSIYQTDGHETGHLLIREPLVMPGPLGEVDPSQVLRQVHESASPWSGLSGALVFHGGLAIGVVVEHHPREGQAALRALPFDTLIADATPGSRSAEVTALLGLGALEQLEWTAPTASEASPVYVKVPKPRRTLVGRDDLLKEARARLLAGDDVALVCGLPGAGKTAIAIKLANDPVVASELPGGCLWLAVGREGHSGLQHWVHRLATWARQLGVDQEQVGQAQGDGDVKAMCELVADKLAHRRCLLVFDDVWEKRDVAWFRTLAGPDCRSVMTTRLPALAEQFTSLSGSASPLEVHELKDRDARLLVAQYCSDADVRFGDRLDRVLKAVAGLPLALVLVGLTLRQRLRVGGQEGAEDFLDEVLREDERLKLEVDQLPEEDRTLLEGTELTLRAVINLSAAGLTPEQQQALENLTVFPPKSNTFSGKAGAYVSGTRRDFTALTEVGLVELASIESSRFALHQAIVDYARQGQEGNPTAYRRMAEFLLDFLEEQSRDTSTSWVTKLRDDDDNLRVALDWILRTGETLLGLRLMAALWPYWYENSLFQRAKDLAEQVLALPEPADPTREERLLRAKVSNDAGNFAYNMADLDAAQSHHARAFAVRQELGEEGLTAGSWNNLGLVLRERAQYPDALAHFRRALEINERTQHPAWRLWRAMNLNNLGITHFRIGDFGSAESEQTSAVHAFSELDNAWGVAMASTDLGEVLVRIGNLEAAEKVVREFLPVRRRAGDDKAVAALLRLQAQVELCGRDSERARHLLLAAAKLSAPAAVSDRLGEGKALELLVIACAQADDIVLLGRASGALDSYYATTGVCPAPWLLSDLLAAQRNWAGDAVYEAQRSAARAVADRGLIHLITALGDVVIPDHNLANGSFLA